MRPRKDLVVAGKYRLDERIARGGMGAVWSGYHEKLDARVAIKFMDPALASSDDMRLRFEREAKAAARLRSPHVVQVLDYGMEDESPYIVMEFLEGEDLHSRLGRLGKLGMEEVSRLLVQASKALRLAAEEGIVHRDLKPGNLFLARSGDDEVLKILDFGVAKALRPTLGDATTGGLLLGSPHYMSPEQARGHDLDHRSDLFSMGVILFHLLTGQRPFRGTDIGDVIVQICSDPIPKVSSLAPELPAELDAFFERAMARDPDDRFSSAREMARAFDEIVSKQLGLGDDTAQIRQRLGSLEPGGSTPMPIAPPIAIAPAVRPPALSDSSQTPKPPLSLATHAQPMPSARGVITGASVVLLLLGGALAYVVLSGSDESRNSETTAAQQQPSTIAPAARASSAPETSTSPESSTAASSAPQPSASASTLTPAVPPPAHHPAGPRPIAPGPAPTWQPPPPSVPAPPTPTPKPHPVLGI